MSILTIVATLIIFGILIGVHEAGHFVMARKCGVVVEEFSIGMGPLIKRWEGKKDNTIYTIRLLPIGGFCKMRGEDDENDIEGGLNSISPFKRILVLAAGALMNLLSALVILILVFTIAGTTPTTTIKSILDNSPAYNSGLKTGDTIIKIDSSSINKWEDISKAISLSNGKEINVKVKTKSGEIKTYKMTPEINQDDKTYKIGITPTNKRNAISVMKTATNTFFSYIKVTFTSVIYLLRGKVAMKELSGPIGVATVINSYISYGLATVLNIAALLSVSLGIFNLLPIPALDGGRIFFCLIEIIKGSPINPKYESTVHMIGFMALMLLMVVVAYQDILRLF